MHTPPHSARRKPPALSSPDADSLRRSKTSSQLPPSCEACSSGCQHLENAPTSAASNFARACMPLAPTHSAAPSAPFASGAARLGEGSVRLRAALIKHAAALPAAGPAPSNTAAASIAAARCAAAGGSAPAAPLPTPTVLAAWMAGLMHGIICLPGAVPVAAAVATATCCTL
eukprot:357899-Chlamydomonas_euryale.AAC.5